MSEYYLDWTLNGNPKKNKYDELKDISSFEKYMLCNYLLNLMEGIDINYYNFKKFFEDLNFIFKFKTKITVMAIFTYALVKELNKDFAQFDSSPSVTSRYIGINQDIIDKNLNTFKL